MKKTKIKKLVIDNDTQKSKGFYQHIDSLSEKNNDEIFNEKVSDALRFCNFLPSVSVEMRETIKNFPILGELDVCQLSNVIQALNSHWHRACEWKEGDILGEGCIWDKANKKLIEFN